MIARLIALILTVTALLGPVAARAEGVSDADRERLREALEVPGSGLTVGEVRASEMPGLYEVQFKEGPLVYSTPDGSFFIVGDLFTVGPKGFVNLAEKRRDGERAKQLAALDTDELIVFPAQGEPRAHITVFTDITCFYCQKLHREVPALNERGIEVRYAAYPRAGVGSEGYRKLATAWCAENKQDALTRMKQGEDLPQNLCEDQPVADHYELGQALGVRGTPAIISESGQMIPGYQSADELMVTLGLD
ncbi:DsbC family protein [Haliea atlantica]|nr:protein-disulfide isomerase [Haliea sp.]MAL94344.1 protein-disulfide isomerase [Haliea sp.]|tara:strand:+ start:234 stop:980 length:747 start_codon:yes stop_codon:yes gene_type:complete